MPAGSRTPVSSLDRRCILVVEDEYFLAEDVAICLRGLGAQIVGPIGDLSRALAAAAESPLDGAVLDINVRGEAIYPLASALRHRGVPFLFMTGYGKDAIVPEFRDVPLCEKPFDPRLLADNLAALLGE